MRIRVLPSLVAVGTLGMLAVAAAGPRPLGYWAPSGFVAQADTLIREGRLAMRCGVQDSVVASFEEGTPEKRFFDRSYLRADVRAFNASPDAARSPFVVEGCTLVGVDPFYHRVDLPYNRLPRWKGDVRYTFRPLTATLEGASNQRLEVRHPDAGASERPLTVAPTETGRTGRASLIRLAEPGSPEVLADVFFVGGNPVLADRRDVGSGEEIRINGYATPPGRMVRLEAGDWVQLRMRERHTWLVEGFDRARTASFVRESQDGVERLYPAARLRPLLEPLAQAMDLALQSVPGGAIGRMDIGLTLDRELHEATESVVLKRCRDRALPSRPRSVSLLVMDGFTGEVLAMPSCPGEAELAAYEPLTTRTRTRFLRNQNLVGHPIGSTGKPFWAAAVATTFPAFLDLEVPAHAAGSQDRVLGCPLVVPYADSHGSEDWVGLEEFLRRSCNRYLVDLATAALALGSAGGDACLGVEDPAGLEHCLARAAHAPAGADGHDSGLRFCDRIVNLVLSTELDVVGSGCGSLQLVDARFTAASRFSALTHVRTYREPTPLARRGGVATMEERYRSGRYRLDAWRSLLDVLAAAGDTADAVRTSLRFSGASPQSANLALNTVEELRRDWINLLLGGENSRWSNFELAEATARLLTGRRVAGSLVRRPDEVRDAHVDSEPAELLGPEALHDGVRRRVLHAMERVASPGGTAARLEGSVRALERRLAALDEARPYDLYVTAKTGTPTVERFAGGSEPETRRGSVLVVGILAVPRNRGREGTWEDDEHVSACVLDPSLEAGIRQVPPAASLDPSRDVAMTVAVYLDDLAPDEVNGAATSLMAEAFAPVSDYVAQEVARRLSR